MSSCQLFRLFSLVVFVVVVLDACTKEDGSSVVDPLQNAPIQSGPPTPPATNPLTNDTALLGLALFWDPILSGNKDIACATCHHPHNAYSDGLDLSLGTTAAGYGQNRQFRSPTDIPFARRNAPTLLNVAFNGMDSNGNYDPLTAPMFWDSRTQSLENQANGPLSTLEEMRGHAYTEALSLDSVVNRLTKIPEYQDLFLKAFGSGQTITAANVRKAIATFERTLVAMNSPYDRYLKGEKTALNDQQIQGMFIFKDEGCAICHSGPMFSDYKLHVLSVPDNPKRSDTDAGAGGTYAFRTPSLRNVGQTAPYMHNGMFQTLKQVLKFYDDIGEPISQNPNVKVQQLDPKIQRIALRDAEQDQLIAFLNALTDPAFNQFVPTRVPSGLSPGGNIR